MQSQASVWNKSNRKICVITFHNVDALYNEYYGMFPIKAGESVCVSAGPSFSAWGGLQVGIVLDADPSDHSYTFELVVMKTNSKLEVTAIDYFAKTVQLSGTYSKPKWTTTAIKRVFDADRSRHDRFHQCLEALFDPDFEPGLTAASSPAFMSHLLGVSNDSDEVLSYIWYKQTRVANVSTFDPIQTISRRKSENKIWTLKMSTSSQKSQFQGTLLLPTSFYREMEGKKKEMKIFADVYQLHHLNPQNIDPLKGWFQGALYSVSVDRITERTVCTLLHRENSDFLRAISHPRFSKFIALPSQNEKSWLARELAEKSKAVEFDTSDQLLENYRSVVRAIESCENPAEASNWDLQDAHTCLRACDEIYHTAIPADKRSWECIQYADTDVDKDFSRWAIWKRSYTPDDDVAFLIFRGTSAENVLLDIQTNISLHPHPVKDSAGHTIGRVHSGFHTTESNSHENIIKGLERAVREFNVKKFFVTGHSLGGALAQLFALKYLLSEPTSAEDGMPALIHCITFGAPMVYSPLHDHHSHPEFDTALAPWRTSCTNFVNRCDPVAFVPRSLACPRCTLFIADECMKIAKFTRDQIVAKFKVLEWLPRPLLDFLQNVTANQFKPFLEDTTSPHAQEQRMIAKAYMPVGDSIILFRGMDDRGNPIPAMRVSPQGMQVLATTLDTLGKVDIADHFFSGYFPSMEHEIALQEAGGGFSKAAAGSEATAAEAASASKRSLETLTRAEVQNLLDHHDLVDLKNAFKALSVTGSYLANAESAVELEDLGVKGTAKQRAVFQKISVWKLEGVSAEEVSPVSPSSDYSLASPVQETPPHSPQASPGRTAFSGKVGGAPPPPPATVAASAAADGFSGSSSPSFAEPEAGTLFTIMSFSKGEFLAVDPSCSFDEKRLLAFTNVESESPRLSSKPTGSTDVNILWELIPVASTRQIASASEQAEMLYKIRHMVTGQYLLVGRDKLLGTDRRLVLTRSSPDGSDETMDWVITKSLEQAAVAGGSAGGNALDSRNIITGICQIRHSFTGEALYIGSSCIEQDKSKRHALTIQNSDYSAAGLMWKIDICEPLSSSATWS